MLSVDLSTEPCVELDFSKHFHFAQNKRVFCLKDYDTSLISALFMSVKLCLGGIVVKLLTC